MPKAGKSSARRTKTQTPARSAPPRATAELSTDPAAPMIERAFGLGPSGIPSERTPDVLADSLDGLHSLAGGILESLAPRFDQVMRLDEIATSRQGAGP